MSSTTQRDSSNFKSVFDLPDSEGINASERILARLCRKSFLSLWAYPNLHTDEGKRDGVVTSSKEFTDLLVVFGNDVVLFSDKHIIFDDEKPIDVAWRRWFKRAVTHSANQLFGALAWLRRFPDRVFLDPQCSRRIPIEVPGPTDARYHLVAVTRGSFEACSRYYRGSLGTLRIRTDLEGGAHAQIPFTVGVVNSRKPFVHVLDEFSLEVLLREFDTAPDFIEYLTAREQLLTDKHMTVSAAGEEQLAAAYLLNMRGDIHWFLPAAANSEKLDLAVFDETHYRGLRERPEYRRKKEADTPSYLWDEIIERFISLGDPKIIHPDFERDGRQTEPGLRLIASENRFRRRMLVSALRGLLTAAVANPGRSRARVSASEQDHERVYVFLVVPKPLIEDYQEYRKHRIAMLHAYCRCAKLKFPAAKTFIGLALDHPVKDYEGMSEDLFVYECDKLSEGERAELERLRRELGILGDGLETTHMHDDEFPVESEPEYLSRIAGSLDRSQSGSRRKQRKKHKKAMEKASRRRNRRQK